MSKFKKITGILIAFILIFLSIPTTFAKEGKKQNGYTPYFSSGGIDQTHQFIVEQGIGILKNDKGEGVSGYVENYKAIILKYTDQPDKDETFPLFACHFYNPYTNKNFLGGKTTAKVKFIEHAAKAQKYYKTNKSYAMQELGRACHFLSDMNEPHHAANLVAGFSNHSEYETWVNGNRMSYTINSFNNYNSIEASSFSDFCNKIAYNSAINAYSYKNLATSKEVEDWDISARAILKNAQESTTYFLYRFLVEVEGIN